jgi:hypothetical protein
MKHIGICIAAAALLLAGCNAHTTGDSSPPPKASLAPSLSAVSNVQLNLNSTPVSPPIQGAGPFQIKPTSKESQAIVSKLLGWLRQAKPLPQTPVPLPSLGDSMLSFSLRSGKSVSVSQYFVQDASGVYEPSPSIVLVSALTPSKSGRYRDPALAKWLSFGWSADLQRLAPHWTCASTAPPSPYQNEISGTSQDGAPWKVAADDGHSCVVFYAKTAHGWRSSTIATDVLSGGGAYVEQVQFVDSMHGFVLIAGSPGAGQDPRALYATQDGGATWTRMPVDNQPFPGSDTEVTMRFTSPTDGWLVTLNAFYTPTRVYVYHTTDGGATWTATYALVPVSSQSPPNGLRVALPPTFQNAQDGTIEVVSQWSGLLFFDTTDGGKHWSFYPLGNG